MRRTSRTVSFAGSCVRIDCAGRRAAEIVEFLFRHVPCDPRVPPSAIFSVRAVAAADSITVRRDELECYRGPSAADAARVLLEAVSFSLAEDSARGLLFHAAAVSRARRVVLLPGKTGAGKTTLTTRLITKGFRYLTDELSYVPDCTLTVSALSRPLNVKPSGRAFLPRTVGRSDTWACLASEAAMLVQLPLARLTRRSDTATLTAIVFPQRQATAQARLVPLGRAETGLRLMACLLNARNLPEHGFHAVADLARRVPAYELQYAECEQADAFLSDLVRGVDRDRSSR